MDCAAQVRQAVDGAFAIAVVYLLLREIGRQEDRTMVSLGGIEDKVEALALLAIVVYHRLDAQLIDGRECCMQQAVEVGGRRLSVASLPVGNLLADILCVDGQKHSVLHSEQHGKYEIQDYAFASAAVAHKQQTLVIGGSHPVDDAGIFGQVFIAVEGAVSLAEDLAEQTVALFVSSPRPRPAFAELDMSLADHLRHKL